MLPDFPRTIYWLHKAEVVGTVVDERWESGYVTGTRRLCGEDTSKDRGAKTGAMGHGHRMCAFLRRNNAPRGLLVCGYALVLSVRPHGYVREDRQERGEVNGVEAWA